MTDIQGDPAGPDGATTSRNPCGGSHFFDWSGEPIELLRWAELYRASRTVANTMMGDWTVLTMWLGHDPTWDLLCPRHEGRPEIFGTIVYRGPKMTRTRETTSKSLSYARSMHAVQVGAVAQQANDQSHDAE